MPRDGLDVRYRDRHFVDREGEGATRQRAPEDRA